MNWEQFSKLILDSLSDDLLAPKWKQYKKDNPGKHHTFGHCYVASEATYHLLGGKKEGWTPQFVSVAGSPHWFLKHKSGAKLDLTAAQFEIPVPYHQARGHGFLTKQPSKRAIKLISRINQSAAWEKFSGN